MKTRICVAGALLSLSWSIGVSGFAAEQPADPLERRVDSTVREPGVLESLDARPIYSQVPGQTTILRIVPEGAAVKKGEVVVELDDSALREKMVEQQIAVSQAKAALAEAAAAMSDVKGGGENRLAVAELALKVAVLERDHYLAEDGEYALELKNIESRIAVAEQSMKVAEAVLKRLEHEIEAGQANPADVEQARLAVVEASAALETSRAAKKLLTEHTRKLRSTALELAVAEATAEVSQLKHDSSADTQKAQAEVASQKAAVELEEERLARLQQQVAGCRIQAPRDGTVVYAGDGRDALPIEEGALVRERQTILLMPDMSRLGMRVSVHESRIQRVRNGQSATIRFDAFPDRAFHGTVRAVGTRPVPTAWTRPGVKLYRVYVTIEKPAPELKLGMTGVVEIDVSPPENQ